MFPKRGAIALITTVLALILLFNFKTPDEAANGAAVATGVAQVAPSPSAATSAGPSPATSSPTEGTAAGSPAATLTPPPATTSSTAQTVTGSLIGTRYGDVEVQVTVAGGKIVDVVAVQLPTGGRSGQISAAVEPILASEALTAQSARIDIVSGATYTSEAYARSLQAALDQVGIASVQNAG